MIVATGRALRERVGADGFVWRELTLGQGSNTGVGRPADQSGAAAEHLRDFLAATREGAVATLIEQARRRGDDLLWRPDIVTAQLDGILREIRPDRVVSDHIAFSATLALIALEQPFTTLVPGHPSQLPVGDEVYGQPPAWPTGLRPSASDGALLERRCHEAAARFTASFNHALRELRPTAEVADAFRSHGQDVLFAYDARLHADNRSALLEGSHAFLGALVRDEVLAPALATRIDAPLVYVSLGTFLSHRGDVLATIAAALRRLPYAVAMAVGDSHPAALGGLPERWIIAPSLPQVALLRRSAVAISHVGNNSVGESLAAGVPLLALPFSTDQFAIAADLERTGVARCLDPNALTATSVAAAVAALADGAERATAARFVDAGAGAERAAERILDGPGASPAAGSSSSGTARGRRSAAAPRPAEDSSGG